MKQESTLSRPDLKEEREEKRLFPNDRIARKEREREKIERERENREERGREREKRGVHSMEEPEKLSPTG